MDIQEINRAVAEIAAICESDPEVAHSLEDNLHIKFIAFVAESGHLELVEMAQKILEASAFDFPRHCA